MLAFPVCAEVPGSYSYGCVSYQRNCTKYMENMCLIVSLIEMQRRQTEQTEVQFLFTRQGIYQSITKPRSQIFGIPCLWPHRTAIERHGQSEHLSYKPEEKIKWNAGLRTLFTWWSRMLPETIKLMRESRPGILLNSWTTRRHSRTLTQIEHP